jgi:AraC family transcriptional regulator of arabinose operon
MHGRAFLLHKTIMLFPHVFPLLLDRPLIYPCEQAWRWQPVPLPDFDLWVVLGGAGEIELGPETHPLRMGTCFLFQPGDSPVGRQDPAHPLVVFFCHFRLPDGRRASRRLVPGILHAQLREWDLVPQSCDRAARVFDEGPSGREVAAALVVQIIAQLLHARARPKNAAGHEPLSSLALEIRSQPARSWNVPAMARRCAMSVPHFNRQFRQQLGESPLRYVIRARVARAVTLLRESDLSLAQIAEATGYRDTFFFHRQFRQIAGATPLSVRLGGSTYLDNAH